MNSNGQLNQNKTEIQSKKDYSNIKNISCKYIMDIIFKNLSWKKSLLIMKYNKDLQNKLDIMKKDYMEYSDIVLELIPIKNKFKKFINIPEGEDESNFHIYFNDDKNEIKRTNIFSNDNVKKIKIIIKNPVTSFRGLFEDIDCIESICFKMFYRTNITNMSRMFFRCTGLKEVNLYRFVTDNVTDMSCMFTGCKFLKRISNAKFNTQNVKDMSFMFCGCSSLKYIDLNFDINDNINVVDMFQGCYKLQK